MGVRLMSGVDWWIGSVQLLGAGWGGWGGVGGEVVLFNS